MIDDHVLARTAEWVRQQRGVGVGDPPLSVARALTLVRVPDIVSVLENPPQRKIRLYAWRRTPPAENYELAVLLAIWLDDGSLFSFGDPIHVVGADLACVQSRFANPDWRLTMGVEPEIETRIIEEVAQAYRERRRQRAEQAAEIYGQVLAPEMYEALVAVVGNAEAYARAIKATFFARVGGRCWKPAARR